MVREMWEEGWEVSGQAGLGKPLARTARVRAGSSAAESDARDHHPSGATFDPVNHPAHYTSHPSGVEAIQITRHFSYNLGNVIKYVWRAGIKSPNPLEDLLKAEFYIKDEIARLSA